LAGVHTNAIDNSPTDGTLNLQDIRDNIRDTSNVHYPLTKVLNRITLSHNMVVEYSISPKFIVMYNAYNE